MKYWRVARVGGNICTLPMTKGSSSAQDELLQSDTWNGEGLAGGGDISPPSHAPSTLLRLISANQYD